MTTPTSSNSDTAVTPSDPKSGNDIAAQSLGGENYNDSDQMMSSPLPSPSLHAPLSRLSMEVPSSSPAHAVEVLSASCDIGGNGKPCLNPTMDAVDIQDTYRTGNIAADPCHPTEPTADQSPWRGGIETIGIEAAAALYLGNMQQESVQMQTRRQRVCVQELPNEVLYRVLEFLDVNDLLNASRTCHLLRHLSLTPILTVYRLRTVRKILPPLLSSPYRPTLRDLMAKSIIMTNTSVVSRRLGRSLASIRLSRRLASRPSVEALVERSLIPKECVPGLSPVHLSPIIVAKKQVIERERVKDVLRQWVGAVWTGKARVQAEKVKIWEEKAGVGRVWRLKRFWEEISASHFHPNISSKC